MRFPSVARAQPRLRERARITALAIAPPMTVPIAATNASARNAKIHAPCSPGWGGFRNTSVTATAEHAHGQIRRGAGRVARAAHRRVAKAMIALNGSITIAENYMPGV